MASRWLRVAARPFASLAGNSRKPNSKLSRTKIFLSSQLFSSVNQIPCCLKRVNACSLQSPNIHASITAGSLLAEKGMRHQAHPS